MRFRINILKRFIATIAIVLAAAGQFAILAQPNLIAVDAPNNQYPITFTDNAQRTLVIRFDEALTTCGTTAGWTVKINGSSVAISAGPLCLGNVMQFTLQDTITYNDRNLVTVTYDSGPGTVAGAGGQAPSFTDVSAINNYIADDSDFINGLYGENPPTDICAAVEDVEVEYNVILSKRYRNSIHYATVKCQVRWEAPNALPRTVLPFTELAPVGSGLYNMVTNYPNYPDNTLNCTWTINMNPYLYNTGTLQPNLHVISKTVTIVIANYKRDDGTPAPGTGSLGIDPPIDDPSTLFCLGTDIIDFIFSRKPDQTFVITELFILSRRIDHDHPYRKIRPILYINFRNLSFGGDQLQQCLNGVEGTLRTN